jgi:osmoprotectant transport system permease protein
MARERGDLVNIFDWFLDPEHWTGSEGILVQLGYQLLYSAVALVIALVIAVPLGIFIGYTGKGEGIVAGMANALRALPTLGLLVLLFLVISPIVSGQLVYLTPTIIVLVLLAVPPILTGTYAGVQNADPDAVGAARAMGYTKPQILRHVQLPCALPLLLSGVRSSTLQIVSTATVAAYLGLQGLGRYIIDGRAQGDFSQMAAGAILVAILALVLEFAFSWLGRLVISPGLQRTTRKSPAIQATIVGEKIQLSAS